MVLDSLSPVLDEMQLNFSEDNLFLLNFILAFLMYGIALTLSIDDFRRLLQYPKKAIAGVLAQWVVMPLATYLLVLLLQPAPSIALGMFLLAACPGGNMSNYLSSIARANVALSVTLTAASTVLCVVMTPLNFTMYGSMYGPTRELLNEISVDPWSMFQSVIVILGVPLILGMLTTRFLPKLTLRILKPVRILSLLIFIAFIVFAFMANYENFLAVIGVIFLLVFLHNALGLVTGYSVAALFRLDFKDRKCLSIETGIHNAALGLILIFTFFEGLGGMAIVAGWWGIWDLISGFALAGYWWYRSRREGGAIA
jgi:BASS family bile acid:Na+ symporter